MFVALYAVINTPKSSKEEIISVSNHRTIDGMEARGPAKRRAVCSQFRRDAPQVHM